MKKVFEGAAKGLGSIFWKANEEEDGDTTETPILEKTDSKPLAFVPSAAQHQIQYPFLTVAKKTPKLKRSFWMPCLKPTNQDTIILNLPWLLMNKPNLFHPKKLVFRPHMPQ